MVYLASRGRAFEHLNLYFDALHPLICDQQGRKNPRHQLCFLLTHAVWWWDVKGWTLDSGVQILQPHGHVESRWEEFMHSLQILADVAKHSHITPCNLVIPLAQFLWYLHIAKKHRHGYVLPAAEHIVAKCGVFDNPTDYRPITSQYWQNADIWPFDVAIGYSQYLFE